MSFEGKMRSRLNAVRHGLTAETVIATLENAEDYQAFEAAVTADYEAKSAGERELVLRLASILWRLRRATSIETAMFESVTAARGMGEDEYSSDTKSGIAEGFLRLAEQPTFAFDRLSRYEHLLWRQARQIVLTLESLRRRKREPRRTILPFSFGRSG
jgi:hypothetical protein